MFTSMMNNKIVFVLTHIPDPRMNKRIAAAKEVGSVEVICVRRIKEDIWRQFHEDVPHHVLLRDYPTSRDLLKRAWAATAFARFAVLHLKKMKPQCIYAGTFDSLLIAFWYKLWNSDVKIVFEVADLRESFLRTEGLKHQLFHHTQKIVYRKVDLLVITSYKFYSSYFSKFFSHNMISVQQNIPDLHCFKSYMAKEEGPFTVGFIGGIRYLEQMKMLVDASQSAKVHLLFAGAGGETKDFEEILEYCNEKPDIVFTGRYDYAKDIANLYGMVDCVYAVYDADNANVRIALPNKLYEAAYCGLPLIASKGTYLGELVTRYNLGIVVNHKNVNELIEGLIELKEQSSEVKRNWQKAGQVFFESIMSESMSERLTSLLNVNGKTR